MPPPPTPASIYNTAQTSPTVFEEGSPPRGRNLGPPSNPMSTLPSLGPPQTPSRSLQPYLEETPSTVRPNAPAAVEMTPASNSQDTNTGAGAGAEFNAQPTQNIQPIASSSGQGGSQAIQSSQINLNPTPLQEYIANLQQQGFTPEQIAQLVSARKGKGKANETLVSVEDDGATFERSAFDGGSGDSDEITEEDKQQEMNTLNAAVPPGTAIEVPPKILGIYQGMRDDLKALWLDPDDPRVISELNHSNEDIRNMNRRIYPNDASSQRKHQIPILNMRFHIQHIRQIYNSMQQGSGNTNLVGRDSQILEAAKIFFLRMQELQIPAVDTMDPAIQATLMAEIGRTNPQAVPTRTEGNTIVSPENLGQMIAPPSARGVMPQQPAYFTQWGIVTGVMPAANGSRVLVNAGTKNLPRYFIYPGAVFGKRVAKNWLDNALLTSVMQRANAVQRLWTDIARVDYMVEVMANSGSRNAIGYVHLVYKENNSQPHLRKEEWQTKSGFFSIANKQQGDMMLRRIAEQDEQAARGWALCKTANIHPETRLPLTDQEKEEMPWLTSQHYVPFQTITDGTVTHEGPQTRSQLQQPAFSTSQPAFTAQQSMLAAQPPGLATQQPAYPTQPAPSVPQPAHPTQQPAYPTLPAPPVPQPAHPTQQPAYPTLPAPSVPQPAHPIQQPAYPTQPAPSVPQPAPPTQQSALPNQLPTRQPMQPTAQTQPSASATPTPSTIQPTYHALFPYQARGTTEVSLDQGELVTFLLDQGNGELQ